MVQPLDRIRVETESGTFDRFNAIEVTNDLLAPAQCGFDVGDDGSYPELEAILAHGKRFKVYLNDRMRLTGRVYVNEVPGSASSGTTANVVVRTVLADAHYASADPKTRVEKTSIKDFLVALYKPLGVAASDFVFSADVERDLMTGVGAKGAKAPADLEPMKVDQAKVAPPESIYEAAAKHLRRFGLLHWDTPDGKVFVGKPDDAQQPLYRMVCKRDKGQQNNIIEWRRVADWTDVPSEVQVFGGQGARDTAKAATRGVASWPDVVAAGFHRPVLVVNEGAKVKDLVDAQARRERAGRSKRKDGYELTIDGWSFGSSRIPYGLNTTVDVDIDQVGGPRGRYLVHRVSCRLDAQGGAVTTMSVVAPGILEV